jgi:hypothetical protein
MLKRNIAFNEMRRTEMAAPAKIVTGTAKPPVDAGAAPAAAIRAE